MSSQRGRKARAGLRTDLGRDSDSDNGDSDYESSNEDSYVPRSTRGGTHVGPGGAIFVESELPEADIRFCGSTNARPTTPRDGVRWEEGRFACGKDHYRILLTH